MTSTAPSQGVTESAPGDAPPPGDTPPSDDVPARGGWTRRQRAVLAGIAVVLFGAFTTYAWARHAKYETTGFDLGIFDQVVRAYAHFDAPTSPLKGVDYNILGDHFHPILVLLVPLYWIWADPRMLLAAQAALLAVSIVPVAGFARRRFGAVAGLLVAAAYGVSWPLQQAVHFDFHEIAFAVPLIALLVDALDRRAHRTVVACCLLLLGVREDMGVLVLLVGLLVSVRALRQGAGAGGGAEASRPGRRPGLLLGGGLVVTGAAGYWAATALVIPAFSPDGFAYWTFPALGPDPAGAVHTILRHPLRVARLMVLPPVKFHTLVTIFYPTGLLALFSPYVLFTLPFLAERMLNERSFLWETHFHYTSVIEPIVVLAAVDTVGRLVRRFPRALGTRRPRGVPLGVVPAFVVWVVAVPVYMLSVGGSDYPLNGLWTGRVWSRPVRWQAVHDVLPMIPPGECVEADNQLAPQLTSRDHVTRITSAPTAKVQVSGSQGRATWVVLDLSPGRPDTGWQGDPPRVALAAALQRGYRIVWQSAPIPTTTPSAVSAVTGRPLSADARATGPVILLHKDQPVDPSCRRLY